MINNTPLGFKSQIAKKIRLGSDGRAKSSCDRLNLTIRLKESLSLLHSDVATGTTLYSLYSRK